MLRLAAALAAGGFLMMAQDVAPDPDFVKSLRSNIRGRFFADVARWTPEKIESEFRKIVAQPALLQDEELASNLLFLVRKREVKALHNDVNRLAASGVLKQLPQISALKTMIALGSPSDQAQADRLFAPLLTNAIRTPGREMEAVSYAAAIGLQETQSVLQRAQEAAQKAQKAAEAAKPPEIQRVSQLDKLRTALETQNFYLLRKLEILALAPSLRAAEMTGAYLRRAGYLNYWAFKELTNHPSPETAAGIRAFIKERADSLINKNLPAERRASMLLDLRLRGLCLLETMRLAEPAELQFIEKHKAQIESNPEFFRPKYDWEDVLDRI